MTAREEVNALIKRLREEKEYFNKSKSSLRSELDVCKVCIEDKGTTINDLGGGPGEIERKNLRGVSPGQKIRRPQYKKKSKLECHSPGKKI